MKKKHQLAGTIGFKEPVLQLAQVNFLFNAYQTYLYSFDYHGAYSRYKKSSHAMKDCFCNGSLKLIQTYFLNKFELDLVMKTTCRGIHLMMASAIRTTWFIYTLIQKKWYIWIQQILQWQRWWWSYGYHLWKLACHNLNRIQHFNGQPWQVLNYVLHFWCVMLKWNIIRLCEYWLQIFGAHIYILTRHSIWVMTLLTNLRLD